MDPNRKDTATYAFILGNHPDLSIAELSAVLPEAVFPALGRDIVLLEGPIIPDPQAFLDRLGGSQKIYAVRSTFEGSDEAPIFASILDLVRPTKEKGKSNFAINCYGRVPRLFQKNAILGTKKALQAEGYSMRFSNLEFRNVSGGKTTHDKIMKKGREVGVFFTGDKALVAELVAVQDVAQYGQRDYHKPERDMAIGLMPPKLAQVMLNLAGLKPGQSFYDPFCGTGGILVEGVGMGLRCYGSDISPEAVEKAKHNLAWILDQNGTDMKDAPHKLFVKDARALDSISFPFDAIVTEGYLGPTLWREVDEERMRGIERQLSEIHLPFLRSLSKYLSRHPVPIVLCLPVFMTARGARHCSDLLDSIRGLGYTPTRLLPDGDTSSLIYARSGQKVGREIFRFGYHVRE